MSVSYSRHALPFLDSSKTFGKRLRSRIAAATRLSKRRSLRMEALERRDLMAGDIGNVLHNTLIPTDVSGDFVTSPIDVLQVVNALKRQSRGEGEVNSGLSNSLTTQPMVDVNNDGLISPIDALMVINRLKYGEAQGELAKVTVQVLDANNMPISPTVGAGGISEYAVAPGQKFSIRTRGQDLRPSPTGIFSVFADINYATEGSATTELAEVLWGECSRSILLLGQMEGLSRSRTVRKQPLL